MDDCIFCQIKNGKIPSEIIFQNEDFFVVKDIAPKAPIHFLIIPKKHIASLLELKEEDGKVMADILLYTKQLAKDNKLSERGYRLMVNTGPEGGQEVMHLHFHFLGGKKL